MTSTSARASEVVPRGKLLPQRGVVVDLAIEGDDDIAQGVDPGLRPVVHRDLRQAGRCNGASLEEIRGLFVRSSVPQALDETSGSRHVSDVGTDNSSDATHG